MWGIKIVYLTVSAVGVHVVQGAWPNSLTYMRPCLMKAPKWLGCQFESFNVYAKACYDCIIMVLALVEYAKSMVCPNLHAWWLQWHKSQPHILIQKGTRFGIFEATYSSTKLQITTHGPGQGSQLPSVLWMIISCILFSSIPKIYHGATFCDPGNQLVHPGTRGGFVDNATHCVNLGLLSSLLHSISVQGNARGLLWEGQ